MSWKQICVFLWFAGCVLCLPCPEHSVFEPKNKYCIWTGIAAPFFSADAQCRSVGGYMLVLDVDIYDFLKNSSTLRSTFSAVNNFGWIDGIDFGSPGTYYDRDGTFIQTTTEMWAMEQPDTTTTNKHCLVADMINDILLSNDDCDSSHIPLCYFDIGASSLCPGTSLSTVFYPAGALCFWLANITSASWSAGQSICQQTGNANSSMAKIQDALANEFLSVHIKPYVSNYANMWIGLTDFDLEGTYKWMDGTLATYINFGGPYPYTTRDCVVMVTADFTWSEMPCTNTVASDFLCYHNITDVVLLPIAARSPPPNPTTSEQMTTDQQITTEVIPTTPPITTRDATTIRDLLTSLGTTHSTQPSTTTSIPNNPTQPSTTNSIQNNPIQPSTINSIQNNPTQPSTTVSILNTPSAGLETSSVSGMCSCPCNLTTINLTDEQIAVKIKELRDLLFMDKKETTSYKRTKISVRDDRISSRSIGYVGVAILVIVVSSIVLVDVPTIITHLRAFSRRHNSD